MKRGLLIFIFFILNLISSGLPDNKNIAQGAEFQQQESTLFSYQEHGNDSPAEAIPTYTLSTGTSLSGSELTRILYSFKTKHENATFHYNAFVDDSFRELLAYSTNLKAFFLWFQSTDIIFPFHYFL